MRRSKRSSRGTTRWRPTAAAARCSPIGGSVITGNARARRASSPCRGAAAEPTTTPRGLADPAGAVAKFHEALRRSDAALRPARRGVGRRASHSQTGERFERERRPGAMGCFRVLDFRSDADGKLAANQGDSWVFAVEFSDPPQAYTVVAYSESGVEGTPHFTDQAPLFSAGKMKRAAFTEAEIQGAAHQNVSARRRVSDLTM